MSHSSRNAADGATPRWRVSLCITELDPGGAERQFVRLATGLDRTRFEPEVICLSGPGPLVEPLVAAGVPVTCLYARGPWELGVLWRLRRHLRRMRPDLLQTFLFHANLAGRLAARSEGVPVVISGIRVAERRGRARLWLDCWTDGLVDHHVCVSRAVAEFSAAVGRLPRRKLVVIPNGVDAERFADATPADLTAFGIPPRARTILFVGRLDPQKDPLRLLDAFRSIEQRIADAHLLYVGEGDLSDELKRRAADDPRVHFAGRQDRVPGLMRAAACLALPSRWEGMPNVVLEAMAAGLPIVAAAAEGVEELLEGRPIGRIVRAAGAEPFAEALRTVIESPPDREQISKAQAIVIKEHAVSRMIQEYEALYRTCLAEPGKSLPERSGPGESEAVRKNRQNPQSEAR